MTVQSHGLTRERYVWIAYQDVDWHVSQTVCGVDCEPASMSDPECVFDSLSLPEVTTVEL